MIRFSLTSLGALAVVATLTVAGCERRVGPTAAMESQTKPAPTADAGTDVGRSSPDTVTATGAPGSDAGSGGPTRSAAPAQDRTRVTSAERLGVEDVRRMQQHLQAKGHDPGPIDGIVGPRTKAALRHFQQAQGLAADGKPDRRTLAALGIETGGTGHASSPTDSGTTTTGGAAGRSMPGDAGAR